MKPARLTHLAVLAHQPEIVLTISGKSDGTPRGFSHEGANPLTFPIDVKALAALTVVPHDVQLALDLPLEN